MKNYLLIGMFCALNSLSLASLSNDSWELSTEKDGVKVHVMLIEGSTLKAFKGTVEIAAKKSTLVEIITDIDQWTSWVPDVVESNVAERTEDSLTYYVKSDLPWPIRDRDGVYRIDFDSDVEMSTEILNVTAVPNFLPKKKRTIRIPKAKGRWTIESISPKRTRVSFQMHADPGGALPDWLINSSVTDTPVRTLSNLKRYALEQASD